MHPRGRFSQTWPRRESNRLLGSVCCRQTLAQLSGDRPLDAVQSMPLPPGKVMAGLPLGRAPRGGSEAPSLSRLWTLLFLLRFCPPLFFSLHLNLLFSSTFCFSLSIFPLLAHFHPSRHTQTPDHPGASGSISRDWIPLLWPHPFPLHARVLSLKLHESPGEA